MKRVTLTAFMVFGVWLSFGQTARFGDLNRNSVVVTSAPPQSVVSVNGLTGAVEITAAQIGALTNEADLAALRAYHYGSPDIIESPAEWFVFNGAGTITAFNWAEGRENVVIPWAIGGVPVTAIGENAFLMSGIVSLIAPQTVTSIEFGAFVDCDSLASVSLPQAQTVGDGAFRSCTLLAYVSLPQAQTVGDYAFAGCHSLISVLLPQAQTVGVGAFESCISLASVYFDDAPAIGTGIFEAIPANQVTVYVTNPQATGWGATLGGMPVVRLPLYAAAVYQAGELVATTGHVAQAIASQLPGVVYSNSVSALMIYTNASGAATSWWQVASGVTNSGTFAQGTPNAITNNWIGDTVKINNLKIGQWPGGFETRAFIDCADYYGFAFQGSVVFYFSPSGASFPYNKKCTFGGNEDSEIYNNGVDLIIDPDVTRSAGVRIKGNSKIDENLTVAKTNTAAVVSSQSGYLLPHLGTNTTISLIFTNGTIQAWEIAQ